jgi:hypothetical protein
MSDTVRANFLTERKDHLRALLHRRGNQSVLLEDVAERGELLLWQTAGVQNTDCFREAGLLDRDADPSVFPARALCGNSVLQQDRHHFVGLALIETGVEVNLARCERNRAQRQRSNPHEPCNARGFHACAAKPDQRLGQDLSLTEPSAAC